MRKGYLGTLIYTIVGIIDGGGHARISMGETRDKIKGETLIDWLRSEFPDVTRLIDDPDQNRRIGEALWRYDNTGKPAKYLVTNSGLCYVVGLLVQMLGTDDQVKD